MNLVALISSSQALPLLEAECDRKEKHIVYLDEEADKAQIKLSSLQLEITSTEKSIAEGNKTLTAQKAEAEKLTSDLSQREERIKAREIELDNREADLQKKTEAYRSENEQMLSMKRRVEEAGDELINATKFITWK